MKIFGPIIKGDEGKEIFLMNQISDVSIIRNYKYSKLNKFKIPIKEVIEQCNQKAVSQFTNKIIIFNYSALKGIDLLRKLFQQFI